MVLAEQLGCVPWGLTKQYIFYNHLTLVKDVVTLYSSRLHKKKERTRK